MACKLLRTLAFSAVTVVGGAEALAAEGVPEDLEPRPKEVQPLAAGAQAPFKGILMTYSRAAKLGVKADQCDAQIELGTKEEAELGDIRLGYCRGARENDRDVCRLKLNVLEGAVEATTPKWHDHPILWFTLGVVATVAATAGAVAIFDATQRPVVYGI